MTLATPANTFTSHWREGPGRVLWAPRGQRRCSKSYDTQDGPTTENGLVPNGSRAPGKCATAGGSPRLLFFARTSDTGFAVSRSRKDAETVERGTGLPLGYPSRPGTADPGTPALSSAIHLPPSVLPSPLPSCSQQPLSTCGLRGAERRLAACTGAGEPLRRCVMIRELAPRSDRGAWTIPEPTAPARARRTLSGRAR